MPILSMKFSRQEYWSGLPFLSSGTLPNTGIKPRSPALQVASLLSEPPGKPFYAHQHKFVVIAFCSCLLNYIRQEKSVTTKNIFLVSFYFNLKRFILLFICCKQILLVFFFLIWKYLNFSDIDKFELPWVIQLLIVHLTMQSTWVPSLVQEDSTCSRATKSGCHNYWAPVLDSTSHSYWTHMLKLLKPMGARAHAPQQKKTPNNEMFTCCN